MSGGTFCGGTVFTMTPALRKVGRVFLAAVACPSMVKTDEDAALEHLHSVDEVSIYLMESRYIDGCSAMRKRAIRKKAKLFARN